MSREKLKRGKVYENALAFELQRNGLKVDRQFGLAFIMKG